jgi:hypothetical protein
MEPLGEALCRLHPEAVDTELLGELALSLEMLDLLGHLRADGDSRERDDIAFAGVERPKEIG